MTTIAIVYFSAFHGHTKTLADEVVKGAASIKDTITHLIDATQPDWDKLNASDAIIFGSPTYMGSVAAEFKKFMDQTSQVWMQQKWKDKLAAAFTSSHAYSGDKLNVLIQLSIFAAQHGMTWINPAQMQEGNKPEHVNRIGSFLGVMAQADTKDPEPLPPSGDRKSAFLLGARVAEFAKRMK
jgi:multimeric flavodoxin WrbA